jgi:hypothetical protein
MKYFKRALRMCAAALVFGGLASASGAAEPAREQNVCEQQVEAFVKDELKQTVRRIDYEWANREFRAPDPASCLRGGVPGLLLYRDLGARRGVRHSEVRYAA